MALDNLLQDLRYTFRTLRRDAGLTTFVILIAGFGIGASSTVFSVVNTLLLRPLPFAEPEQLVWIANRDISGLSGQTTQVGHMLDLRERDAVACRRSPGTSRSMASATTCSAARGEPERLSGVPVSDNFFDVLGVQPQLGRVFNGRRRPVERTESGAAEPRSLAAAVRLGSGDCRHRAHAERRAAHGRRRAAGVVRLRIGVRARQPLRSVLPVSAEPGDQSLGQHDGDDRPPEAGCVRGRRRRPRSGRWRPDHEGASGAQQLSRGT